MAKRRERALVISQEQISPGIFSILLRCGISRDIMPGQFVLVYCNDGSRLLGRPLSVCQAGSAGMRIVYRTAGAGTCEISELTAGAPVYVLGPLGNGFPLEKAYGKRVLILGGGIGVPPMVYTAEALKGMADITMAMGYRDANTFLERELSDCGRLLIATEDGSRGTRGNVLDAVRESGAEADLIFACGPKPMLKAVSAYASENEITAWISLEERMACGIGACLACVCTSKEIDAHSNVYNKRVCKDGPVFNSEEVIL